MNTRTRILTLMLAVALLAPLAAAAQDGGPPIFVWVNFLKAQPGQSDALTSMLIEEGTKTYDSLVASGDVVNWGVAMNVVHDGGDAASHVEWVSFVGWEAMDKFMAGFMAAMQAMSPEERAAQGEQWAATVVAGSHADSINRSVTIGGALSGRPGYIHLSYFQAAPGMEAAAMELWNDFVVPTFDGLVESGDIKAYGLHVPALHRNYPWTHMSWFSSSNLAARGAVDQAMGSPSEEMASRMAETFTDRHEDQILVVVHFKEGTLPGGE